MLERNDSVRYIILYFTAYTMPSSPLWDGDGAQLWADATLKVFGGDVWREFLSPWRYLQIPTLAARRNVTDAFFYIGRFKQKNAPLLDNENYRHFLRIYQDTNGWMPENDIRTPVPATECRISTPEFFDIWTLSRRTYLQEVLESYAALARKYGVTLIVTFQPTACTYATGAGSSRARAVLEQFKKANPDVEIPFDVAESWPPDRFSVPAHVTDEFSPVVSERLGRALADIAARHPL
jgi:hypothetical protein